MTTTPDTTGRTATPADLHAARRTGAAAYGYPRSLRAPGADATIRAMIGDAPVGEPRTLAIFRAYQAGWDACADVEATTGNVLPLADRLALADSTDAAPGTLAAHLPALRDAVTSHQHAVATTAEGADLIVDVQTAHVTLTIRDALNPTNRARLDAMPLAEAAATAWRLATR